MASTRLNEGEIKLREQLPPEHLAGFDRFRAVLLEAEGVAREVFPNSTEPDVAAHIARTMERARGRLLESFVGATATTAEERDL